MKSLMKNDKNISTKKCEIDSHRSTENEKKKVQPKTIQKKNKKSNRKQKVLESDSIIKFTDYNIYCVNDIVWVKLKGYPHWPAEVIHLKKYILFELDIIGFVHSVHYIQQIKKIITFSPFRVEVKFFGDATKSNVFQSQMIDFKSGFKVKEITQKLKSNIKLNDAGREAMISFFFKSNLHLTLLRKNNK